VRLGREASAEGRGGPFGCVVVKDGVIVGRGGNGVVSGNDPTAHAEILAVREACRNLGTHQLTGCVVYASCEPCPMCLGALYWARPAGLVFAATRHEAAAAGFDDALIYDEMIKPPPARQLASVHHPLAEARRLLAEWPGKPGRVFY
jgi:guanine deaminase